MHAPPRGDVHITIFLKLTSWTCWICHAIWRGYDDIINHPLWFWEISRWGYRKHKKKPNPYWIRLEEAATYSPT